MRCLACGEEMRRVGVVADAPGLVAGYAYHSFECPACHDTETRLLFRHEPVEDPQPEVALAPAEPGEVSETAPPTVPEASVPLSEEKAEPPSSGWGRALAKLRLRRERLETGE
jgi:hypothetical protein